MGGSKAQAKVKKQRNDAYPADDTPKAFARLMSFQANGRFPSGLDDGVADGKKRKRDADADGSGTAPTISSATKDAPPAEQLRILPGEKMSDFSARVNHALPVSGLVAKGGKGKGLLGSQGGQTRLERKMQRMQEEWRREEERRRARREEELEELEDDAAVADGALLPDSGAGPSKKRKSAGGKKKKGKNRTNGSGADPDGDNEDDEGDPWERVRIARNEPPRRLHDVVQAPPKLTAVPKPVFKVANGAAVGVLDVPRTAGSLRKREELGLARRDIVERYRTIMEERRGL